MFPILMRHLLRTDYGLKMKSFLVGVVLATFITTGVNHVTATTNTKSVSACADKRTGALRLKTANRCRSTERSVVWPSSATPGKTGAQGPAGAQGANGAQGIQGVQGAAGANGLSRAYKREFRGSTLIENNQLRLSSLIYLPAGKYIVTANLVLTSPTVFTGTCQFGSLTSPSQSGIRSIAQIASGTAILQTSVVLPNDNQIEVNCQRLTGESVVEIEGSIYAIAVDAIESYNPSLDPTSISQ
jgi:hypothetical protein